MGKEQASAEIFHGKDEITILIRVQRDALEQLNADLTRQLQIMTRRAQDAERGQAEDARRHEADLATMEQRATAAERAALDAGKANADAIRAALADAASRVSVFGRQYGINAQNSDYEHFAVRCAEIIRELAK